jgi:DNA-binding response OmpR family regulator
MMVEMPDNHQQATLLVVDDTPFNLKLVLSYLERSGFNVETAESGAEALRLADDAPPDLILLDVMMPQMDGFECCRRLKNNPFTRDIPVIFMTALSDVTDKVKGFEAGGVDYLTKPVEVPELMARVNIHLQLCRLRAFLEQQSAALREKNLELEQQYKELNTFSQCMTADLKKPLAAMAGLIKILDQDLKKSSHAQLSSFSGQLEQTRGKMANTVDNLLLLASVRTKVITSEPLNMVAITAIVRDRLESLRQHKQAKITAPANWPDAWGYAPWVEKVWEIYLRNALTYGGKPAQIEMGAATEADGQVRFWVKDNGPGLSADEQSRLGDGRVELLMGDDGPEVARTKEGYGVELSIVQHIIERLGGQVGLSSQVGKGSTFYFTLPATQLR